MELFEYAVIYIPDAVAAKEEIQPSIIVQPTFVLALDQETVEKIAIRAIPKEYEKVLDDCEVLVRPFE